MYHFQGEASLTLDDFLLPQQGTYFASLKLLVQTFVSPTASQHHFRAYNSYCGFYPVQGSMSNSVPGLYLHEHSIIFPSHDKQECVMKNKIPNWTSVSDYSKGKNIIFFITQYPHFPQPDKY